MKKQLLPLLAFVCLFNLANAQWHLTSCPVSFDSKLGVSGTAVFSSTSAASGVYMSTDSGATWKAMKTVSQAEAYVVAGNGTAVFWSSSADHADPILWRS